jgi:2-C-methyl-D-erythritol 2,4-cyclodiphosphate synthase
VSNLRIGFGFDSHQIEKGDSMTLGGVEISCGYQIIAHSDGDVVTHAICDALLGAAHLGDLGSFVPDDDSTKNLSSLAILKNVMTKITDLEMTVINIDSTFVGNIPRLEPYKSNMENKLAEVININSDNISCKATTTDGMGPEGRNEGISAYATVLLEKIK